MVRTAFGCSCLGSWRMRRQYIWLLCVAAGIFLLFVNFSTVVDRVEEESRGMEVQQQQQKQKNPLDSRDNHLPDRVQFIKSNGLKEVRKEDDDASPPTKQSSPHFVLIQDRHDNAVNLLESRGNNPNDNKEEDAADVKVQINELPFASNREYTNSESVVQSNVVEPWDDKTYKYNPYGQPIYHHSNKANYIPVRRVVHFDLKGAPLKPSIYKTILPWLAQHGATTILLEYEDMFPWYGRLSSIAAGNHYSKEDIRNIVLWCKESNLEIIPLVPTFGHMEFALKQEMYSYLREVPELPQSLCPSQNDSLKLVKSMIDQMMELHQGVKFLHIGCDEVFQMGDCDLCRKRSRESIFLKHVSETAKYARNKYKVIPIIWHDMLEHISKSGMVSYGLGELVEPMVWVYAEDVYRFVQPGMWAKLNEIFPYVWSSSAFKGAFKEQMVTPNVRRHLDNNLNWIDVMIAEGPRFSKGFRGIVLTGWQRFDHFAVLCELFPVAIPSLAVNLIATSNGYFNSSLHPKVYKALSCMKLPKYQTELIDLDADPFLYEKFTWCFFPGALAFKMTANLESTQDDVESYFTKVLHSRGWITDYNRRHNFSVTTRIDQDLEEMQGYIHKVSRLIRTAKDALSEWFDDWTIGEWIELHIWPMLNRLEMLEKEALSMKNVKVWQNRPFPLLKRLIEFGISEPPLSTKGGKGGRRERGRVASRLPANLEVEKLHRHESPSDHVNF